MRSQGKRKEALLAPSRTGFKHKCLSCSSIYGKEQLTFLHLTNLVHTLAATQSAQPHLSNYLVVSTHFLSLVQSTYIEGEVALLGQWGVRINYPSSFPNPFLRGLIDLRQVTQHLQVKQAVVGSDDRLVTPLPLHTGREMYLEDFPPPCSGLIFPAFTCHLK